MISSLTLRLWYIYYASYSQILVDHDIDKLQTNTHADTHTHTHTLTVMWQSDIEGVAAN